MELWVLYTYDLQKTEYAMLRGGDQRKNSKALTKWFGLAL